MKNNDKLLEVLGEVRDDLIPNTLKKSRKTVRLPIKFAAVTATITAAAVAGVFIWQNIGKNIDIDLIQNNWEDYRIYGDIKYSTETETLPQLLAWDNNGRNDLGIVYYSAAQQMENNNPWIENKASVTALPVFKNLAYNGYMTPVYLNEKQMTEMANNAAKALEIKVEEVNAEYYGKNEDILYGLEAVCSGKKYGIEKINISVTADGIITIDFSGNRFAETDGGYIIPSDHSFTVSGTDSEGAEKTLSFLASKFENLLQFKNPVLNTYLEFADERNSTPTRVYKIYDQGDDITEQILNYNFAQAEFKNYSDNLLAHIKLNGLLSAAEYVGDYPLISLEEAKEQLLKGNFYGSLNESAVKNGKIGSDNILNGELVYYNYRCEYYQPYYRFMVELDRAETGIDYSDDLTAYGTFYVNAIKPEYLLVSSDESNSLERVSADLSIYPINYTSIDYNNEETRMASDISELKDNNPWSEDLLLETLPVFEVNNLSHEQMIKIAKDTVERMGLTFTEGQFVKQQEPNIDKYNYSIYMSYVEGEYKGAQGIYVVVYGTGDVEIRFNKDGNAEYVEAPKDLVNLFYESDEEQVQKTADYLKEELGGLAPYDDFVDNFYLKSYNLTAYMISEEQCYRFYENSDDIVQKILNYNLNFTEYAGYSNYITDVVLNNKQKAARKLGDYPLITVEEASENLLNGNYLTLFSKSYIKDGELKAEDVKSVDLIYKFSRSRYLIPYYRFYAEIERIPVLHEAAGVKDYGAFYVPAISPDYIIGDPYTDEVRESILEDLPYKRVYLPDGSAALSEVDRTFIAPQEQYRCVGFDFGYLRYSDNVFYNTIDNPEIHNFSLDAYHGTSDEIRDLDFQKFNHDYFRVKAGDKLDNGLTVKSADFNVVYINNGFLHSSRVVLDGEITLEGIVHCNTGYNIISNSENYFVFYPDTNVNNVPVAVNNSLWSTVSEEIEHYYDYNNQVVIVTDGSRFYLKNTDMLIDKVPPDTYVRGRITLKNINYVTLRAEEELGYMFDRMASAEVTDFLPDK